MALTPENFQRSGLQLLPLGHAWTKNSDSDIGRLMLATGEEFSRVDGINNALLAEIYADRSFLMLKDWEDFTGLPDCSIDRESTINDRRQAVKAKLVMTGSLCLEFYKQLAIQRGFNVQLEERFPHHCLRTCNTPIYPQENWFRVFVIVDEQTTHWSTVIDNCLQRLKVADSADLECLLERYIPAETEFIFIYE